jgi:hypothetical protein
MNGWLGVSTTNTDVLAVKVETAYRNSNKVENAMFLGSDASGSLQEEAVVMSERSCGRTQQRGFQKRASVDHAPVQLNGILQARMTVHGLEMPEIIASW